MLTLIVDSVYASSTLKYCSNLFQHGANQCQAMRVTCHVNENNGSLCVVDFLLLLWFVCRSSCHHVLLLVMLERGECLWFHINTNCTLETWMCTGNVFSVYNCFTYFNNFSCACVYGLGVY